ncbi:hypothetical protein DFS34DRAFT_61080 [Phlyctochytrium arcticum]|nr:hypothetical protein DFS34DRAFT_61080 [Phlyctochytrium arcticum]
MGITFLLCALLLKVSKIAFKFAIYTQWRRAWESVYKIPSPARNNKDPDGLPTIIYTRVTTVPRVGGGGQRLRRTCGSRRRRSFVGDYSCGRSVTMSFVCSSWKKEAKGTFWRVSV